MFPQAGTYVHMKRGDRASGTIGTGIGTISRSGNQQHHRDCRSTPHCTYQRNPVQKAYDIHIKEKRDERVKKRLAAAEEQEQDLNGDVE